VSVADLLPSSPRFRWLLLAILLALVLFPGLRVVGLAGYDDALYAHEAKEMLRTGDWWNVRFNGELNFEYPPMFLWLDALSMRVFGVNDFAAKLPSALAGFGTILALYFLTVRIWADEALAWGSAFVLATTQPFLKLSGHAMTDVTFTFFCTLALLCYAKGIEQPRWLLLAGIAAGCAILTRSVLGLTPVAVMLAHGIAFRKDIRPSWAPSLWAWIGCCALALAVPLAWMGSQYQLHGEAFLNGHLGFVSQKVAGTNSSLLHSVSYSVFGVELLKYYWPWLPVMLVGFAMATREVWLRQDHRAAFPLIWAVLVAAPLGFAGTQYGRYILPAFPPFAMLSAVALRRWIPARLRERAMAASVPAFLLVAAYAGFFPGRERGNDMRILAPVAEAQTSPGDRVLLYTSGQPSYDYRNQFLWYANRFVEQVTDFEALTARVERPLPVTAVIDKPSSAVLLQRVSPAAAARVTVAAESGNFVCFRTRQP
jgi:4-amino-4-deoxy-L-arabinose transferase-like glycosyltransferase